LDAYFVQDLCADAKRRAVVESLVTLANALDSSVVAEGVGSKDDLSLLEAIGVDLSQANLLCPAISLKQLLASGLLKESVMPEAEKQDGEKLGGDENYARAAAAAESFYT
jgi:EAL domain-containing protein (putative c-di-GMP-specific phosphodiesterase class I)